MCVGCISHCGRTKRARRCLVQILSGNGKAAGASPTGLEPVTPGLGNLGTALLNTSIPPALAPMPPVRSATGVGRLAATAFLMSSRLLRLPHRPRCAVSNHCLRPMPGAAANRGNTQMRSRHPDRPTGSTNLSSATSHKPWRRRHPSALPARCRSGGQSEGRA